MIKEDKKHAEENWNKTNVQSIEQEDRTQVLTK